MAHPPLADCLDDALLVELERVAPEVRRMVEHLVSNHGAARLLGLDAIQDVVLHRGRPASSAPQALPFLFALAGNKNYPHAAAVLERLDRVVATLDEPPRSLTTRPDPAAKGGELIAPILEAYRAHIPVLLRIARSSRDPAAARAAVRLAGRFPEADAEIRPVLIALLSGTRDPQERGPLLYDLARLEPDPGGSLHPHVERVLAQAEPSPEQAAVALALAERDPEPPLRHRVARVLGRLADAETQTREWPDPREWGSRYVPEIVREALAHLEEGPPPEEDPASPLGSEST